MTPRILAIDTTSEFGSIALSEGDRILEEVVLHSPDGFGHLLFDHLRRLLSRHNWNIRDIDCFASAAGPGSFTGVRVGLTAVKGFAEAARKTVAAVSNLQALAEFGSRPLRATILDARRGEIYGAVYNAALEVVSPESVTTLPRWLETLPVGELEFLTTDIVPFESALASRGPVTPVPRALAAPIARIAAGRLAAAATLPPESVDANYVRRSDAELFWKE